MAARLPSEVPVRVLQYVRAHEGAHFRDIQRTLGLSTGQADHHLRAFVRRGYLARTRLAGEVHFFPATRPRPQRRPLAALRQPSRATVARALLDLGPAPLRALVARTGMPESTLLHHLRVLLRAGVVFREEAQRHVRYGLGDPALTEALLEAAALNGNGAPAPPRPGSGARPSPR